MGSDWVHLRACQTCGHVGCCESSRHKHALKHFQDTGHPVIQFVEEPEVTYCYVDDTYQIAGRRPLRAG